MYSIHSCRPNLYISSSLASTGLASLAEQVANLGHPALLQGSHRPLDLAVGAPKASVEAVDVVTEALLFLGQMGVLMLHSVVLLPE